jgi:hypothetical protein
VIRYGIKKNAAGALACEKHHSGENIALTSGGGGGVQCELLDDSCRIGGALILKLNLVRSANRQWFDER